MRLWNDPSVIGTGAVARTVALNAAGVPIRAIARHVGLPPEDVGALLFAYRVDEASRDGLALQWRDPAACVVADCGAPVELRGLCLAHASKIYRGSPLRGAPAPVRQTRMGACEICGARWCEIGRTHRKYCSDRCRSVGLKDWTLAGRDAEILRLVDQGMEYPEIGDRFGLGRARVGQIAREAGRRRGSGRWGRRTEQAERASD